jgi:hypothetical protein
MCDASGAGATLIYTDSAVRQSMLRKSGALRRSMNMLAQVGGPTGDPTTEDLLLGCNSRAAGYVQRSAVCTDETGIDL